MRSFVITDIETKMAYIRPKSDFEGGEILKDGTIALRFGDIAVLITDKFGNLSETVNERDVVRPMKRHEFIQHFAGDLLGHYLTGRVLRIGPTGTSGHQEIPQEPMDGPEPTSLNLKQKTEVATPPGSSVV